MKTVPEFLVQRLRWWEDPSILSELKRSLQQGHISITSTDTILGFLAPVTEPGFFALNKLKGARQQRPYIILVSSIEKLANFVDQSNLTAEVIQTIRACWPGRVTFVFKAKKGAFGWMGTAQQTVAIRCPEHQYLPQLLDAFDGLYSTSANKSDAQAPKNIQDLDPDVVDSVDYVVVERAAAQDQKENPSTILDISNAKSIKVLRQGAFDIGVLKGLGVLRLEE